MCPKLGSLCVYSWMNYIRFKRVRLNVQWKHCTTYYETIGHYNLSMKVKNSPPSSPFPLSLMSKKYVLDNNARGKIFLQIINMNIMVRWYLKKNE